MQPQKQTRRRANFAILIGLAVVALVIGIVFVQHRSRGVMNQFGSMGKPALRVRLEAQLGQKYEINDVCFTPDGKRLITAGEDPTAKLWDVETGEELRSYVGHIGEVRSVAVSPDGKTLATGSADGTAKLWDLASGREITTLRSSQKSVTAVCFSPVGNTLAVGDVDASTTLWNSANGAKIRTLPGSAASARSICFSPDGMLIATGSVDHTFCLWDVATGTQLATLGPPASQLTKISFSHDGKTVATAVGDRVTLWDVSGGRIRGSLLDRFNVISSFAFSPDGKMIAASGSINGFGLWDAEDGRELQSLPASNIRAVCFSPDGRSLVASNDEGETSIWDVAKRIKIRSLLGRQNFDKPIGFTSDESTLIVSGDKEFARLWNLQTGLPSSTFQPIADSKELLVSDDGKTLAKENGDFSEFRVWDVTKEKQYPAIPISIGSKGAFSLSPDGKYFAMADENNRVTLWNTSTGRQEKAVEGAGILADRLAISRDGKLLAVGGSGAEPIVLWNISTGARLSAATGPCREFDAIALSPDGKTVAAAMDKKLVIWDEANGTAPKVISGASYFYSVSFSPDGKTLIGLAESGPVVLWDVETGRENHLLEGHGYEAIQVCFSPDGKKIGVTSSDGTIKLVDGATGEALCTLISFDDGAWAVTDPEGRFDGSANGEVKWLHWVVSDPNRNILEPVALSQFAGYYYTPGLLGKIWKGEPLQKVPDLQTLPIYPTVIDLVVQNGQVKAKITDRGGGIGDVHVFVNGLDVKTVPGRENLDLDLAKELTGLTNPRVALYAYNRDGSVHARAAEDADDQPAIASKPAHIVAVIGGVEHYAERRLDLSYSDSDAIAMTKAVIAMADGLKVPAQVELVSASTDASRLPKSQIHLHNPDKKGFQDAFQAASKMADEGALYFVYLSGHGSAKSFDGGKTNEFYFLTKDVNELGSDWINPTTAPQWSVSSGEIVGYLAQALNCKRRLVILDTCDAGAAKTDLLAMRGEAEDEARARREFQEGTGTYALMGAAQDRASFEASEFGHGLMTYSILYSLKYDTLGGGSPPDAVPADVLLRKAAERTAIFARQIGRGQQPAAVSPDAGPLVIGRMTPAARQAIDLHQPLPVVLKPILVDASSGDVSLQNELATLFQASPTFAVYLDSDSAPNAYRLQGHYSTLNNVVTVSATVWKNGQRCPAPFPTITGSKSEVAKKVVDALKLWIAKAAK